MRQFHKTNNIFNNTSDYRTKTTIMPFQYYTKTCIILEYKLILLINNDYYRLIMMLVE